MTFFEYIALLLTLGSAMFLAFYLRKQSHDMIGSTLDLHRERMRNIKGNYEKPDKSDDA